MVHRQPKRTRAVVVGSRVPELQELALGIFQIAMRYQISIEPEWVPREENKLADYLSRIIDYDEWMVNPSLFIIGAIDSIWGPHTVDRFTNSYKTDLDIGVLGLRQ